MYLSAYGLERLPFESISNASVYVDLPSHREAFNTIVFGLRSGEGFLKVVGEVGTGKTALCRALLGRLDPDFVPLYLPNPALGPEDFMRALADELGVSPGSDARLSRVRRYVRDVLRSAPRAQDAPLSRVQRAVRDALLDVAREGGRSVLFIDEAQTMPDETLETLRLLSNLESNLGRLVQVVFFGQPEFDARLEDYALRPLQQRIAFAARLDPLDRAACREYIQQRLAVAGSPRPAEVFSPAAIERIHRASGGIPRLINLLCHKSLIASFCEGEREVGRRHAARAVGESEGIRRWQTRPLWPTNGGRGRLRSTVRSVMTSQAP